MSQENNIEDSLQVCQEIKDFLVYDDLKPNQDTSQVFNLDNETFREIDRILAEENAPKKPKPEPVPIENPTPAPEPPKPAPVQEMKPAPAAKGEMESEELPEIKLEPTGGESELKPKIQPTPTIPDSEIYFDAINDDLLEPKARNDSYDTEEEYRESHPFLRGVLSTCICILTALVLSLFITKYVAYHTSVEGSSMRPTLINGDQLIVEKLSYYLHDPERFDIVVFPFSEDVSYIKRVIGLPGETVQIRDGLVYINGELLEEKYGEETIHEAGLAANEILLGEDEYFVLGDNRNASVDSRTDGVGMISKEEILGRAWYRVYPFDRASLLK